MKKSLVLSLGAIFLLSSCADSGKSKKDESADEVKTPSVCTYTYNQSQTTLTWTAFKFTEKAGVKGSFDSLSLSVVKNETSIPELLVGAEFSTPVSSVNSNNVDRDQKIQKFFFGSLNESSVLKGRVTGTEGDDNSGSLSFLLKMNEMEGPVEMNYSMSGDTLILIGTMDVNQWNAQAAVTRLNKECKELHTGTDGVSILWPDVRLEIRSILTKTCN